jgi:hypothetical protein
MARPWVRWLSRIAIVIVVVAALVLPLVLPEAMQAIATVIATKVRALPTASVTAMVVETAQQRVALAAILVANFPIVARQGNLRLRKNVIRYRDLRTSARCPTEVYLTRLSLSVKTHDSPHLSDRPENVCEEWLVLQHEGEALHQRTQPTFRHHGN